MSKRNFILLIIMLVVIVAVVFGFLYFKKSNTTPPTDTGGTNFGSNLTPFGPSKPTPPKNTPPANVSGGGSSNPSGQAQKLKLTKVSTVPVAGFGIFQKARFKNVPEVTPATTVPVENVSTKTPVASKPTPPPIEVVPAVRYVDRVTGNIFETFADAVAERKFSTTIIPKIYEAYFGNNGDSVVMRYLKNDDKTIETFVGTLPAEVLGGDTTGDNEIKGSYLPENISDMSISPDTFKAFYIFNTGNNVVGTTYEFKTTKKTQVFDSPFTEWLSSWPNTKIVTITTKPSADVAGFMYTIDPSKKDLTKALGDINGLTTLESPNGKFVLFGNNNVSLAIYHTDTRSSDALAVHTIPEKCTWASTSDAIYCAVPKSIDTGNYPDAWYKGEVSFSDEIWKIDVASGTGTMILDPLATQSGEEIDGIKLALSPDGNYLFFVNKKDSYLWELDLRQ